MFQKLLDKRRNGDEGFTLIELLIVIRFQPERGLKFETYAITRMRGAVVDELRSQDWVPRSVRRKARELEAATERCHQNLGRTPTDADIAESLGRSQNQVRVIRSQVHRAKVDALDALVASSCTEAPRTMAETLADPQATVPGEAVADTDLHELVRTALDSMPERDRAVIMLSYLEGRTLAQIGSALGVTESRVSQLRTRSLRELRDRVRMALAD